MPGGIRRVGRALHAGDHPDQAALYPAGRDRGLKPADVVEVVDDHGAHPGADGELDLLGGLGVAVQDQGRRIGAGRERGDDLPAAGHVQPQPLGHHQPLRGRAGERLGREGHLGIRPPGGQLLPVVTGLLPHRALGHHERRRAVLGGQLIQPAPADPQHAVAVLRGAGREQAEQVSRRAHAGDPRTSARLKLTGSSSWAKPQDRGSRSGRHRANWAVCRKRVPSMCS